MFDPSQLEYTVLQSYLKPETETETETEPKTTTLHEIPPSPVTTPVVVPELKKRKAEAEADGHLDKTARLNHNNSGASAIAATIASISCYSSRISEEVELLREEHQQLTLLLTRMPYPLTSPLPALRDVRAPHLSSSSPAPPSSSPSLVSFQRPNQIITPPSPRLPKAVSHPHLATSTPPPDAEALARRFAQASKSVKRDIRLQASKLGINSQFQQALAAARKNPKPTQVKNKKDNSGPIGKFFSGRPNPMFLTSSVEQSTTPAP